MQKINVDPQIHPTTPISHLTTIIYNQYQTPVICDMLTYPLTLQHNFLFLQKSQASNNEFYITIKICEVPTKQQQQAIEKLIGLSDHVLCVQLNQQLQSMIETMFVGVIPELYVRYEDGRGWIHRPKIYFVNESYRKVYFREAQGIYYFRTIQQYLRSSSKQTRMSQRAMSLSESRISIFSSKNLINQSPVLFTSNYPSLSLQQFLNLYNNTSLSQKQSAQIKYSIISYKSTLYQKQKKQRAQQYLFKQGFNDLNKSVLRQISKQNISKKDMIKLQWKYGRLKAFGQLVYQQKINIELVKQYKTYSILQLSQDIIILQIKQFYRHWIRNTLKILKSSFYNIANRRDIKTINQFRQKCIKCIQILSNCLLHCQTQAINYTLLQKMQNQFQQFINAHENVIKDQYLSAIKYFSYHLKYKWKNQPKIYHKVGFVLLILFLAYMQKNIVVGVSLVSVGIILSVINI